MMYPWAVVGAKVECVFPSNFRWDGSVYDKTLNFPVRKGIYTIREVTAVGDRIGLKFNEIVNPPVQCIEGYEEISFIIKWFRPLKDEETSLEVFKKLILPVKELVHE